LTLDARYWDRDFETRPWAWIEAWQAQQLATMLETLPHRSEMYRELLGAAGRQVGLRGYWVSRGRLPTLDMLADVPFTTRDQLHAAQEGAPPGRPLGLQQAVPQQYIVQVVSSSDEARPVFSGLTRRDQEVWSDAIANSLWTAGIRPDDVVAHLANAPADSAGWPYADGLRRLGATVAWLGGWPPERVLERLPLLQVTALLCPPEAGLRLAEAAIASGAGTGVDRLLVVREPDPDGSEARERIAAIGAAGSVRDTMGLAEVMAGMWSECCEAGGMHFNAAKYVIVELVDGTSGGRVPWTDGAAGEAVYTTFDRDATPVLRYRSGDLLEVAATRCACGRTSPRVRWLGRAEAAAGESEAALVRLRPVAHAGNGGGASARR
jgi:phenylacetate-coenzyme A ligase PaaK-like adenylate-forming protein